MSDETIKIFDKLCLVEKKRYCNPHIVVEINGDYNDGDYTTKETVYALNNNEDIAHLTTLLTVLRQQTESLCTVAKGSKERETCDGICSECSLRNPHILDPYDLMDEIYDIVNLPMGPYGVCHTLRWMTITYVDENGCGHELVDSNNLEFGWGFPIKFGTSHY